MLDLKSLEPKIEVFYPLLLQYSPDAAILYGYLKHLIIEKDLHIKQLGNESYYDVNTSRYEIKLATGLSEGKQIDAEIELIHANLAISFEHKGNVGYDLYPCNEDCLRRYVNKTQNKWSFTPV